MVGVFCKTIRDSEIESSSKNAAPLDLLDTSTIHTGSTNMEI